MGTLDSDPGNKEKRTFELEPGAISASDEVVDGDRTPAMPSVIEVTPAPSAVDTGERKPESWVNSLGAKISIAAIAIIGAATAVTGSRDSANATDIRPDNTVEAPYKNLATPMMSKDGKSYQMNGTYEKDFNLEVSSPENPKAFITVKVGKEGKYGVPSPESSNSNITVKVGPGGIYEVKGKFEKPASQIEFKASTIDGKEITFMPYEEVLRFINQNPENPKPIVGTSVLHSTKGVNPTRTEVYFKNQE